MNLHISNKGLTEISFAHNSSINMENSVYEILRFMNKVPLFVDEHFERLQNSLVHKNASLEMSIEEFKGNIHKLIDANNVDSANIKVECLPAKNITEWSFSIISAKYPSEIEYKKGIVVGLLQAERENPNLKIFNSKFRNRANELINQNNYYEVLLYNQNGYITEGSRSNVFFVRDNELFTAPSSMVLVGITRNKVIDCILKLGYNLRNEPVNISELENYQAAFITGTSPKVLPIFRIGNITFDVENQKILTIMNSYNSLIDSYVLNYK